MAERILNYIALHYIKKNLFVIKFVSRKKIQLTRNKHYFRVNNFMWFYTISNNTYITYIKTSIMRRSAKYVLFNIFINTFFVCEQ